MKVTIAVAAHPLDLTIQRLFDVQALKDQKGLEV